MSADLQFKQIIDRILRCREAEDAAKDDTKEVYAELKALGYDKTAAGALVGEIRQKDKNPDKFTERNATLDLYRDAYERASGTGLATHTHAPDPKLIETVVKGVQTEIGRKALVTALDIMIEREEANEQAAAKGAANEKPETARAEPEAAAEVAGNDLREPVAAGQGQIIREGDAPRETDCQAGEASQGGSDASCSDTEFTSAAPSQQLSAPEVVIPPSASGATLQSDDVPAFLIKKKTAADYRPNCLRPDACGASGLQHCYSCRKAMAESEAA